MHLIKSNSIIKLSFFFGFTIKFTFINLSSLSRGEVQSTSTLNDWAGYVDKINKQDWG